MCLYDGKTRVTAREWRLVPNRGNNDGDRDRNRQTDKTYI